MKRVPPVPFIQKVCSLDLREFQREWLEELFREQDGKRIYSSALLGVPRGNGKTELASAVALKLLLGDGTKRPQVVIAAGSDKQAGEAFDAASAMVTDSPFLRKHLRVLSGRKVIRWRSDEHSWLRTVSAEGPLQHGMKPSAVIFDEVWNQRKRELWEALVGGLIKRPEPLLVAISSAGYDSDSLLWELCKRGEAGTDPRFFYRWYAAPMDADYRDPKTWKLANPAMACENPFLAEEGLADNLERMHESEFRRWHLGQWTAAEHVWIEPRAWDDCAEAPKIPDGADVVLGVDAAIRHDSTAVATVHRDSNGVFHAQFRVWLPPKRGEIDLSDVTDYIREQSKRYRVKAVAYDEQFMAAPAQELDGEGIPMIGFPQSNAMMVPATHTLYHAVVHGKLRHGGDPVARTHALNAGVAETERGLRIKKTASRDRIDALVALVMAVETAARQPASRSSVYEDRALSLV